MSICYLKFQIKSRLAFQFTLSYEIVIELFLHPVIFFLLRESNKNSSIFEINTQLPK